MCGIAGAAIPGHEDGQRHVHAMLHSLAHRGPDDQGVWSESELVLGQRRLSILDLSAAGHQPMHSQSGRFVTVYNGEIYNYLELRADLDRQREASVAWKGHSDTEVLLAGFETWGIFETLSRANGMFALAVWDSAERNLYLGRDRIGEKPVYFGWVGGKFAFASEMKALACLPSWNPRMSASEISGFLTSGYISGCKSAIQGIYRLQPATILKLPEIRFRTPMAWEELSKLIVPYWSLESAAEQGILNPFRGDRRLAGDSLEALLTHAVSIRKLADVPIGAFLSGGIDSSLIAALMQKDSIRPVRTYSIGFKEAAFDESKHARAVADHLHTEHTAFEVGPSEALSVIPELASIFDEPFADQSAIPTLLVSRLARRDVTVALSGDGGDELFGGYGRYDAILPLWKLIGRVPAIGRRALSRVAVAASRALIPFENPSQAEPHSFRIGRFAERVASQDLDDLRRSFIAGAGSSSLSLLNKGSATRPHIPEFIEDPLRRLLYGDQIDYLSDNILVKLDRASMAASLEARAPFLDHRIVEFSWSLASEALYRPGAGKLVLRDVLYRHVPRSLFERPKQGFSPPIGEWLRGPLREWAQALLSKSSLQDLPMVDAAVVERLWVGHQSSRIDAGYALWNVLMLAAWRQRMCALAEN